MRRMTVRRLKMVLSLILIMALVTGSFAAQAFANIADKLDPEKIYRAVYDSMTEVEDAAAELNLQLEGEGAVLLKNSEKALPLAEGEKVTVLGTQADTLATGGSGSGGQTKPGGDNTPGAPLTLFEALDAAGIEYNPSVKAEYEKPELNPKTLSYSGNAYDGGHYMQKVDKESADSVFFDGSWYEPAEDGALAGANLEGYTDTALVVLSRSGAEGQDNDAYDLKDKDTQEPVTDDISDHYLQLTTSEKELMAYAKKNFEKVVVLINSPSAMELGCLEYDEDIDAVLWIGQPGWNGIMAVGQVLTGEVNPSGRTVDIYMADFATDPTFYNFGDFTQANAILNGAAGEGGAALPMGYDEAYVVEGVTNGNYKIVDYAENIYLGYRYYETVYAELKAENEEAADEWYANAVVYPFGYGLSYTEFDQKITGVDGDLSDPDGEVTVKVEVTNTGDTAGKEVAQIYATAPYFEDEIEKAAVNLVAFEKTGLLQPGESEELSITFRVKDLASFDYNDANGNDFCGYELEAGEYVLSARNNSHDVFEEITLEAAEALTWDEDGDEDTPNNIFSAELDDDVWGRYNTQSFVWTVDGEDNYLRRTQMVEDGVVMLEEEYEEGAPNALQEQLGWAAAYEGEANLFTVEAFNLLNIQETYGATYLDYDNPVTVDIETDVENPWIVEEVPDDWTQNAAELNALGMYPIELSDMVGVPLEDEQWTTFMNQLSWEEMKKIANDGGYGSAAIKSIGKPAIEDHDGPGQLRANWSTVPDGNGYAWACESVIGSTWNKELGYEQGVIVANEGILLGVSGWYGPGMNIHRSPLSGRNFEYYSQDGVQGGYMLAAVSKGATDYGMHIYMKHAFLNDQETSRSGVCTFATEQAIREIYAKPFELAVRYGNANGMMTSFNRIGLSTSAAYAIAVQMYEKEWGFDGISVTDAFYAGSGWTPENLVRAHIMPLNSRFLAFPPLQDAEGVWDETLRDGQGGILVKEGPDSEEMVESATEYYAVRETAMRALYTYANSNAITGLKAAMLLKDRAVNVEAGKAYEGFTVYEPDEVAAFVADMNKVYGEGNYDVFVTEGPEGVALSWEDGTISGTTPEVPGFYPFTVTVQGKGNMSGVSGTTKAAVSTAAVVDPANVEVSFAGLVELIEGENYIPDGDPTNGENEGKYTSVKYTAEGLPENLTIDETTGVISGSIADPIASGESYEVVINQEVVMCEDAFIGWFFAGRTIQNSITVYLTVK